MTRTSLRLWITTAVCLLAISSVGFAEDVTDVAPEVEVLRPGVTLTQVAEHPLVMTPTGIDIDRRGQLWVVCSHTHFRPEDYQGPPHDEIVVLGDERSRRVFYAQTDATMDLELGTDGWVYLAERDRILRVRDEDGDGVGDREENLAVLETEADYPHNGLSGLAWHPSGDLIFALGENYWQPWTLTGSGGESISGTGEGGIFRCRPDGSSLRRIARGFWNPFGVCVRADGTLFAAENDPGARPPCRLLHVVEGGDYGYQRLYGNAPVHPFVAWNGELRGTLPMLHSLGEAPCGIAPLGNGLIVPSWTEHRIDFYPLRPAGASFQTERIELVQGGRQFRPTCITQASDTVFYLTDWVLGSYNLHGYGRVWKLEIDPAVNWLGSLELAPPTAQAMTAERLRSGDHSYEQTELLELARDDDPYLARAAIDALSHHIDQVSPDQVAGWQTPDRVSWLLAVRTARPRGERWIDHFLADDDPQVQFEVLRWVADERLEKYRDSVEQQLREPDLSFQLFEASLATLNTLSGQPREGVSEPAMLLQRVQRTDAAPRTRAFALRLLDPQHPKLGPKLWDALLKTDEPLLTAELTRSLAASGKPAAASRLIDIAEDESLPLVVRADALAAIAPSDATRRDLLLKYAANPIVELREEALRALRFTTLDAQQQAGLAAVGEQYPDSRDLVEAALDPESIVSGRPSPENLDAWQRRIRALPGQADRDAGRRVFHHAKIGLCRNCHRHFGRGSVVGPDLTAMSNQGDPSRILQAVLQPSRDVDPQYYPWSLLLEDGSTFTGIMLRDGGGGSEFFRDNEGRERKFATEQIIIRKPLTTSMMPDGLVDLMTDREIRDLIAFLDQNDSTTQLTVETSDRQDRQQVADADRFLGSWWFDFADGYGGWLKVQRHDSGLTADLLWRVGSPRSMSNVRVEDRRLLFDRGSGAKATAFRVEVKENRVTIVQDGQADDASKFAAGGRCPPMPPRPDLSTIRFGEPIDLLSETDLSGWRLQPADAENGWSLRNGVLVNETPKTDFSAYGNYGNLRTKANFEDFRLQIEFNIGADRNSGVYLRGLYEAQVVDRDSPMQGIAGPGAIFGRIAPSKNAGLPGGRWQTYDLTLVDRHVTVVLNGERVIDNQPVEGCTGGALFGDVTRPGPIYLQGDHTSVKYRNIRLWPRLR